MVLWHFRMYWLICVFIIFGCLYSTVSLWCFNSSLIRFWLFIDVRILSWLLFTLNSFCSLFLKWWSFIQIDILNYIVHFIYISLRNFSWGQTISDRVVLRSMTWTMTHNPIRNERWIGRYWIVCIRYQIQSFIYVTGLPNIFPSTSGTDYCG